MRQIAERANVSPMTVSRVLRGRKGQASPETVERILAASRELSYIPVHSTMQNKHQKKHIISVVFEGAGPDRYLNPLDVLFYQSMCRAAAQRGYDLLNLLRADSDWVLGDEELRYLDRRSDGLIFVSSKSQDRQQILEVLASHDIPTVVFGRRDVPDGIAWVDVNNQATAKMCVEHLIGRGHRKIAFLAGPQDRYDRNQRKETFTATMLQHGLGQFADAVVSAIRPDFNLDEAAADELLNLGVTAIVCVNDYAALQLWDYASSKGIAVPDQLSLVGVDNIPEAGWRGLTTVDTALDRAGAVAVETWIARFEGQPPFCCHQELPAQIIERSSVLQV